MKQSFNDFAENKFPREGEFADFEQTPKEVLHAAKVSFKIEQLSKAELARHFMCEAKDITPKEEKEMKNRLRFLHNQLVAAMAKKYGAEDSVDLTKKVRTGTQNYAIQFHDIMHAAVAFERNHVNGEESAIPGFLDQKRDMVDEASMREEVEVLLFSVNEWATSKFVRFVENFSSLSFQEVFDHFQNLAFRIIKNEIKDEMKKINPPLSQEVYWAQLEKISALADIIRKKPTDSTVKRAKRIFDGWRAGNKRILADEFLAMTKDLPLEKAKALAA